MILPKNDETKDEFGLIPIGNHNQKRVKDYCSAAFEVCHDVLNKIAIKSVLSRGNSYEVNLASEMLEALKPDDLVLCDRLYFSYRFLADLTKRKIQYVIRCSRKSFLEARNMFKDGSPSSKVVKFTPGRRMEEIKQLGLPEEITLRLVRVILPSGEVEVLATSLMDEQIFSVETLKELYFLRWGVETFFSKIKGRLDLENFTGKSVEAIKQDFWSTIFISNLETVMTEDVEADLNADLTDANLSRTINKSVSFNAIKNLAFDILSTESDIDHIMSQLSKLFLMNTLVVRKGRKVDRHTISNARSMNYQKRVRKRVF